jgi:hypothetical protein
VTVRLTAEEIDRALEGAPPLAFAAHPTAPPIAVAGASIRALLRGLPAPEAHADHTLEQARAEAHAARRRRVEAARAALEPHIHPKLLQHLRARPTPSALLLGPTGVGKTMAARWLRAGIPGEWCHARDLAGCERRHPLGDGLPSAFERACSHPVLYLDDLGTEEARDVGVLQHVLERRYASCLATVTTTGLTRDQLTERYRAPTVRRLTDQHAPRRDGSHCPVLLVDLHQVGGAP